MADLMYGRKGSFYVAASIMEGFLSVVRLKKRSQALALE